MPLSSAALDVLRAVRALGNQSQYVFTEGRNGKHVEPGSISTCLKRLIQQQGGIPSKDADGNRITVHGFRTTFKSWCIENEYPDHLSEIAIGHAVRGAVSQIYARLTKVIEPRRLMMEDWAQFCGRTEQLPSVVTPIRSARKT